MNWLAEYSRRHVLTACAIVFIEILLYRQYASMQAEFHFWIHGLFGAALGMGALTVWRLMRPKPVKLNAWEAGFMGHLYSAVPDLLFVGFGVLHMYWMDVFALHISLHFIPAPIIVMLTVFLLTLAAAVLANEGYRRLAAVCLVAGVSLVSVALIFRQPVPQTLQQVRAQGPNSYSWLCPMAGVGGH